MSSTPEAMAEAMGRPQKVYVLRDQASTVLYVGCTSNLPARMAEHCRRTWGPSIDQIETLSCRDGHEGRRVEAALIAALRPLHNRQHPAVDAPTVPLAVTDLLTTAEVAARKGVRIRTVNRWASAGRLVPAQVLPVGRGAHLFDPAEVDAFEPKPLPPIERTPALSKLEAETAS